MRFAFLAGFNFVFPIAAHAAIGVAAMKVPFLLRDVPLSSSGGVTIPAWPLLSVAAAVLGALVSLRLADRLLPRHPRSATIRG